MKIPFSVKSFVTSILTLIFMSSTHSAFAGSMNFTNAISGNNPSISLVCSGSNDPYWGCYTLGPNSTGGAPCGVTQNKSVIWSTWNAVDKAGKYYGTFTVTSDCKSYNNLGYANDSNNGFYFDGVNFNSNTITVSKVNHPRVQLVDYIGTGNNPNISLTLVGADPDPNKNGNGQGWPSYTISYGYYPKTQNENNIPCGDNDDNNWSVWNAKDEKGVYFGTFTIRSNCEYASTDYKGGDGNYFQGVNFVKNGTVYSLNVDAIYSNNGTGPFADAPLAAPAVHADGKTPVVFSTQGANIVNDQGQVVLLKGIVRPSLEWNKQGQFLSADDIKKMHDNWGANVIRLDLWQAFWFASGPESEKGSYRQIINAIVYYAIQNHMAVILDLHWTGVAGDTGQKPMANKDSITFWSQVATQYKDFGTVIFELFNEPIHVDQNTWLNGSDKDGYAGYQQLYDAVRATGAKNVVIVNGLNWGYDLSFVTKDFGVKGNNIVYGSHPYHKPHEKNPIDDVIVSTDNLNANFAYVLGKYPLIFTEYGVNSAEFFPNGYQAVYKTILDFANANHINYTAFAWWVGSDPDNANTFPCVVKDWDGTPLNGGVQIQKDMQANPGTVFDK